MGYYFVIMMFHIYITRFKRNCIEKLGKKEREKKNPKYLMILSKQSVKRRKDLFASQTTDL